jgi:hypothetical protein
MQIGPLINMIIPFDGAGANPPGKWKPLYTVKISLCGWPHPLHFTLFTIKEALFDKLITQPHTHVCGWFSYFNKRVHRLIYGQKRGGLRGA